MIISLSARWTPNTIWSPTRLKPINARWNSRKTAGAAASLPIWMSRRRRRNCTTPRRSCRTSNCARAQTLHALAILCGQSPVDFQVADEVSPAMFVPDIPPSLPSELLEHRPDIAAAERRMAAANADIGVAKAAFFPTVKINGLAGFQSMDASSWFDWPSRFWSVGPVRAIAAVHRRIEPRQPGRARTRPTMKMSPIIARRC